MVQLVWPKVAATWSAVESTLLLRLLSHLTGLPRLIAGIDVRTGVSLR